MKLIQINIIIFLSLMLFSCTSDIYDPGYGVMTISKEQTQSWVLQRE